MKSITHNYDLKVTKIKFKAWFEKQTFLNEQLFSYTRPRDEVGSDCKWAWRHRDLRRGLFRREFHWARKYCRDRSTDRGYLHRLSTSHPRKKYVRNNCLKPMTYTTDKPHAIAALWTFPWGFPEVNGNYPCVETLLQVGVSDT